MRLLLTRLFRSRAFVALLVVGVVVSAGLVAATFSFGRAYLAVQRCQNVADAAALAAKSALPDAARSRARALLIVKANNDDAPLGLVVKSSAGDITVYTADTGNGTKAPDWPVAGPRSCVVKVTCRASVPRFVAKVFHLFGKDCSRSAVATSGATAGDKASRAQIPARILAGG